MSDDASNESPTSEEGPRQLYKPRREEIVSFGGGAGGNAQTDLFVMMLTPDARLNCKFTLLPSSEAINDPAAILDGRNLTLWLFEMEKDDVRGKWVRSVDLAGSTALLPIPLPANAALGGFSREFVTSADAIGGRIRVPAQPPGRVPGSLYLQARFQPAAVRINPWSDWDEVRRECNIRVLQDVMRVP